MRSARVRLAPVAGDSVLPGLVAVPEQEPGSRRVLRAAPQVLQARAPVLPPALEPRVPSSASRPQRSRQRVQN
jgi:hypothetical protein